MNHINLKIKLLSETCKVPTMAHSEDACFDLYADLGNKDKIIINPHETVYVPTGIATEIPVGWWAPIFARSGISSKRGLRPSQGVAVIDCNYRGEWKIPLHNESNIPQVVENHERFAQFTLLESPVINLDIVDELSDSDRGSGGFGSSGKE